MNDSGTVDSCPLCGAPIEPFGKMRHRFVAEDLQADEICFTCARFVAPEQVALALKIERLWADSGRYS